MVFTVMPVSRGTTGLGSLPLTWFGNLAIYRPGGDSCHLHVLVIRKTVSDPDGVCTLLKPILRPLPELRWRQSCRVIFVTTASLVLGRAPCVV